MSVRETTASQKHQEAIRYILSNGPKHVRIRYTGSTVLPSGLEEMGAVRLIFAHYSSTLLRHADESSLGSAQDQMYLRTLEHPIQARFVATSQLTS